MATARTLGGRYEVGDRIGRGSMADVYLGRDTHLDRPVAIKILRPDLARERCVCVRFRREARAAARLNNPAIVTVHDVGRDDHVDPPAPYIVMELLEGRTLREVIARGPLHETEAADLMLQLLSGLAHAHSLGIVHRDIKPSNVMVTADGSVKLMDFGLARAVDDVNATLTPVCDVLGTPRYLSPEQAHGGVATARSDIYAAGCVFYELLTGTAPFDGDAISLVDQHVNRVPDPPSSLGAQVSRRLDRVVLQALEKDPALRFQSAQDFAQALRLAVRSTVDV